MRIIEINLGNVDNEDKIRKYPIQFYLNTL